MQGSQMVRLPITAAQASFLNKYAEAVQRYRSALQEQIENNTHVLDGLESGQINNTRSQTAAEVVEAYGRLEELSGMVWLIFDTDTEGITHETVGGYLLKASENIGENKKAHSIFNRWIFEPDLSR